MQKEIIKDAVKVLQIEKKAINDLEKRFSKPKFQETFSKVVESILKCKGKIVITGIGKSGIIARKIAATFNSTGTNSIFLHSADSLHGDLGIIKENDIIIIISKSGDTEEVKQIVPVLKKLNLKIISITGNTNSELAKISDLVLDTTVKEEACPHNLAPTSSTTVALVLGDAIAISLLKKRGFTKEEYALFHPGGNLGKKLLLKVEDIMSTRNNIPIVDSNALLKNVIYTISSKRLGCACVVNKNKIVGIITDGDIRRSLEKNLNINKVLAKDIMNKNPKIVLPSMLAKRALEIMENFKITQLLVCNDKKNILGIIHLHKLIEEGL